MTYITRLDGLGARDLAVAGGKGANLGELFRAGLPVPTGFVLTTAAYDAFVAAHGLAETVVELATPAAGAEPGEFERAAEKIRTLFLGAEVPHDVAGELTAAYAELGGDVAVRSSATAEDLPDASFAGQQETFLHVRGAEVVVEAVRACWASLWTARAMAYRAQRGIDPAGVRLAVVVQRMVEADASGVLFTANPVTGRRDQTVISAAWGLGEAVVGGSVCTDDLVVDTATGHVVSRATADKQVMTLYAERGTQEQPVPEERRRRPVLDDAAAAQLVRLGTRVAEHFGSPQDIEWARADGELFVLQARPVTALPEPAADAPTDWSVPERTALYARASIVEQLPEPLTPLFADLIDGAVERSLRALLAEFGAADAVRDGDVGLPTVNGYAYYRYALGAMLRTTLRTPLGLRYLFDRERGARQRWRDEVRPGYARTVATWGARPLGDRTARELVAGVGALLEAGTAYYTTVQTIIPIAVTTEQAFTGFYDRFVRRAGDPPAATFLLGFDSTPLRAEKSLYDLATWARGQPRLAEVLVSSPSDRVAALLAADRTPDGADPGLWHEWRTRFRAHLDRYGHTVYNLDFANPVPADHPAPLLDTLRFYLRGEGVDPHERQRRTARRREEETAAVRARLDPARRVVLDRLLGWAQDAAPLREDALADVGLGWPLLRRMLLELGRRLVAAGAVDEPDDVFWLRRHELDDAAAALDAGTERLPGLVDAVAGRKTLWHGQRRATPPQLLPERTWRFLGRWMPATTGEQGGATLRGVGASAGVATAPARVLAGPAEFGGMRPGEVLVASITTPAWTSLFAMAAAVVTDVGGPLSHSSIVAREYGIPAVLGTGVATRRIRSGQPLRVDGDAGTVQLLDEAGDGPASTPAPRTRTRTVLGAAAVLAVVAWAWRKRS
jgi:pyruvate,water dikinase